MKLLHRFHYVWAVPLIIAGLTWGIIGVFSKNIVAEVFSSHDVVKAVYVIFGVAAILHRISIADRKQSTARAGRMSVRAHLGKS